MRARDGRVLVLDYDDFRADPAAQPGTPAGPFAACRVSREACQAALDAVWQERAASAINKGVSGRGRGALHRRRRSHGCAGMLDFIPSLAPLDGPAYSAAFSLFGGCGASSAAA